jgi:uncharacterized protein YybS (DUF2232 family)
MGALFFTYREIPSLLYLIAFGLPGVALGVLAKRIKGPELLLPGVAFSVCCKLAASYFLYKVTGFNILSPDAAGIERAFLSIAESASLSSMTGQDAVRLRENIESYVEYVLILIPYSLMVFASLETMFSCILSSKVHKAWTGEGFFKLPPFGKWSFPRNILVPFAVGILCEFVAERSQGSYLLAQVSANLGAVTWTLFAVQGLAVAYFFMELRGFPKIIRVVIIVLTPLFQVLGGIFSIVGILDIGFDLRKRAGRKNS